MKTRKRIFSIIAAVLCLTVITSTGALAAEAQQDQLSIPYQQSHPQGQVSSPTVTSVDPSIANNVKPDFAKPAANSPPTQPTSLPYQMWGPAVSQYTYMSYYFTGRSSVQTVLNGTVSSGTMNLRFALVDKTTGQTPAYYVYNGSGWSNNGLIWSGLNASDQYYFLAYVDSRSVAGSTVTFTLDIS